jgi:hypothetical protein
MGSEPVDKLASGPLSGFSVEKASFWTTTGDRGVRLTCVDGEEVQNSDHFHGFRRDG